MRYPKFCRGEESRGWLKGRSLVFLIAPSPALVSRNAQ